MEAMSRSLQLPGIHGQRDAQIIGPQAISIFSILPAGEGRTRLTFHPRDGGRGSGLFIGSRSSPSNNREQDDHNAECAEVDGLSVCPHSLTGLSPRSLQLKDLISWRVM